MASDFSVTFEFLSNRTVVMGNVFLKRGQRAILNFNLGP
jgi:hypothetical protein